MVRFLLGAVAPLLVVLTVLLPGRTVVPVASAQGQAPPEPLQLFSEMMPVFTHDRCLNCHGEVIPSTGENHDGGVIDPGESCTSSGCHSQADNTNQQREDDWKVPQQDSWFKGKDAKALCEQMADRVMNLGRQDFMDHLQKDFQIELAFEGRSGGANEAPEAAPPPMEKPTFLAAATRWMDDGFAACDREGTIVHTESITSDENQQLGPAIHNRFTQSGRRTVTIQFANGQYRAEIEVVGQTTITQTIVGAGPSGSCRTIITSIGDYEDDGPPARASGGTPGNITSGAGLDVKFEPDGTYTITVHLGPEKHKRRDHYSVQDECGTGVRPSPAATERTTWQPTRFVIRGKLTNPRDRTRLVGRSQTVVTSRVPRDEEPWLHDHYGAAAQNGNLHPVTVHTTWNIRYRQ